VTREDDMIAKLRAEVDVLTEQFGDDSLRKRNAAFDRQLVIGERRAAPVVAVFVTLAVLVGVGIVAASHFALSPQTTKPEASDG
jgi:hypothetical protein